MFADKRGLRNYRTKIGHQVRRFEIGENCPKELGLHTITTNLYFSNINSMMPLSLGIEHNIFDNP